MIRKSTILARAKKMFRCDLVRIIECDHCITKYLIIGFNKRSDGEWVRSDESGETPIAFDYVEQHCIAHGNSWASLWKDVKFYKSLEGMTMENYLKQFASKLQIA